MSLIRCGEEGYKAYIYADVSGNLVVTAPSFSGALSNYASSKLVIECLVAKKELPPDFMERFHNFLFKVAVTQVN